MTSPDTGETTAAVVPINSARDTKQRRRQREYWEKLYQEVFGGGGEALARVFAYARARKLAPIPLLLTVLQRVCTSLPPGATFEAGLGPGSMNLFTVLVGESGSGKDTHINAASEAAIVRVGDGAATRGPVELGIGSGEGIVTALEPGEDGSRPVLFMETEAGNLAALFKRKGSTLRPTLLKMYSGGALGATNKNDTTTVPRLSYTAGLVLGCQPDKAGVLLGGEDDGFKHRFVWTEMIDPLIKEDGLQAALFGSAAPDEPRPVDVFLPDDVMHGKPLRVAREIEEVVVAEQENKRAYGVSSEGQGHSTQTRIKLSCALALLRGRMTASMDDWRRAGVLMSYSRAVYGRSQQHLDSQEVDRRVKERRAEEETRAKLEATRSNKVWEDLCAAVETKRQVHRSHFRKHEVTSAHRGVFDELLDEALEDGILKMWRDERGRELVGPGERWEARGEKIVPIPGSD